jgi:hypothetical protein
MKITKRKLRRLVEQAQGHPSPDFPDWDDSRSPGPMGDIDYLDPMTFMDKIDDMDDAFQDLKLGVPFRSAGVRMALAEMQSAYLELGKAMRAELDVTKIVGD